MSDIEKILGDDLYEIGSTESDPAQPAPTKPLDQPTETKHVPSDDEMLTADAETEPVDDSDPGKTVKPPEPDEEIKNIDQVAASFGVETSAFTDTIMVPGLHDGEMIPLTQALNEWRTPTDATRFPQVAQEIHRLNERESELVQEHQANIQLLERNLNAMVVAVGEEDNIDWDKARDDMDPDEYRERKAKFGKRKEAFQGAYQMIQEQEKRNEELAEQERTTLLQKEATQLLKIMPQWGDDTDVASNAKTQMAATAQAVGLSPDDLNEIVDHRHVLLLWKASEFDRLSQLKKSNLPGLRQLPRISLRSGARRAEKVGSEETRAKILAEHQSAGTQESAADAISALLDDEL